MPSIPEGVTTAPRPTRSIGVKLMVELRVPQDASPVEGVDALRNLVAVIDAQVSNESLGLRGDLTIQEVYFTR